MSRRSRKTAAAQSTELRAAREQNELLSLTLANRQLESTLSAIGESSIARALEGYYDPSNFVDPRDYIGDPGVGLGLGIPRRTNVYDREDGHNRPVFQTEGELAAIRGLARALATYNRFARSHLNRLTDYVVGATGFVWTVGGKTREQAKQYEPVIHAAQYVIDRFLDDNDILGEIDRELFRNSEIDGEYFVGLWHQGGRHVDLRIIEPDQVTEPTNPRGIEDWLGIGPECGHGPSSWSYGVHTDDGDTQAIHGYYCQWTTNPTDWDYLPGGNHPIVPGQTANAWMAHDKINVPRSVKRGLSSFYATQDAYETARKLYRNMGEGAALQAAIAWVEEFAPGTNGAGVATQTASRAEGFSRLPSISGGSREVPIERVEPGRIIRTSANRKFLPGPMGAQHAPNYTGAGEAMLRSLGMIWGMPENMANGSAANNNYASILVAGDPFVKAVESSQQHHGRVWSRILWRVLRFAFDGGCFDQFGLTWEQLEAAMEVRFAPPQVEVREPDKETTRRQVLVQGGVMSRETWAAEEGLILEEEEAKGAKAVEQPQGVTPMQSPSANPFAGMLPTMESQCQCEHCQQMRHNADTTESRQARIKQLSTDIWEGYP